MIEKYINKPNLEGELPQISIAIHAKLVTKVLKLINLCIFKTKPEKMENGNFRKWNLRFTKQKNCVSNVNRSS